MRPGVVGKEVAERAGMMAAKVWKVVKMVAEATVVAQVESAVRVVTVVVL